MTPADRRRIIRAGIEIVADKALERLQKAMGRRESRDERLCQDVREALQAADDALVTLEKALKKAIRKVDDGDLEESWDDMREELEEWRETLDDVLVTEDGDTFGEAG